MPAIYVTTVRAQEGKEEAIAQAYQDLAGSLANANGFKGRHVLRELAAAAQGAPTGAHAGESREAAPPAGVHFIATEIWESQEARANHRKTEEFLTWYKSFTQNLQPEHTHGWYEDIAGH